MHRKPILGCRSEPDILAREPGPERLRGQDHRHPVMQFAHGRGCLGGENGEGLDEIAYPALGQRAPKHRALGHTPPFPQPGKRHRSAVAPGDEPRLTDRALAPPLIVPVHWDQAPPFRERRPERGLDRGGLGSCIDELVTDGGVLRPGRNESPPDHGETALAGVVPHHRGALARCEVVARAKVRRRPGKAQQRMYFAPGEALSEAAAHGRKATRRSRSGASRRMSRAPRQSAFPVGRQGGARTVPGGAPGSLRERARPGNRPGAPRT